MSSHVLPSARSPSWREYQPKLFRKGYTLDRFLDAEKAKLFLCEICENVSRNPRMCSNGHFFCKSCLSGTRHLCRSCFNSPSTGRKGKIKGHLLSEYRNLKLKCSYFGRGCVELTTLEEIDIHESECPYRPDWDPKAEPAQNTEEENVERDGDCQQGGKSSSFSLMEEEKKCFVNQELFPSAVGCPRTRPSWPRSPRTRDTRLGQHPCGCPRTHPELDTTLQDIRMLVLMGQVMFFVLAVILF